MLVVVGGSADSAGDQSVELDLDRHGERAMRAVRRDRGAEQEQEREQEAAAHGGDFTDGYRYRTGEAP